MTDNSNTDVKIQRENTRHKEEEECFIMDYKDIEIFRS